MKWVLFLPILLNIVTKHIVNKTITCNDRDAPWIRKTAIKRNTCIYRKWVKRGEDCEGYEYVREIQNATNKLIRQAKQRYYSNLGKKLSDPRTGKTKLLDGI